MALLNKQAATAQKNLWGQIWPQIWIKWFCSVFILSTHVCVYDFIVNPLWMNISPSSSLQLVGLVIMDSVLLVFSVIDSAYLTAFEFSEPAWYKHRSWSLTLSVLKRSKITCQMIWGNDLLTSIGTRRSFRTSGTLSRTFPPPAAPIWSSPLPQKGP